MNETNVLLVEKLHEQLRNMSDYADVKAPATSFFYREFMYSLKDVDKYLIIGSKGTGKTYLYKVLVQNDESAKRVRKVLGVESKHYISCISNGDSQLRGFESLIKTDILVGRWSTVGDSREKKAFLTRFWECYTFLVFVHNMWRIGASAVTSLTQVFDFFNQLQGFSCTMEEGFSLVEDSQITQMTVALVDHVRASEVNFRDFRRAENRFFLEAAAELSSRGRDSCCFLYDHIDSIVFGDDHEHDKIGRNWKQRFQFREDVVTSLITYISEVHSNPILSFYSLKLFLRSDLISSLSSVNNNLFEQSKVFIHWKKKELFEFLVSLLTKDDEVFQLFRQLVEESLQGGMPPGFSQQMFDNESRFQSRTLSSYEYAKSLNKVLESVFSQDVILGKQRRNTLDFLFDSIRDVGRVEKAPFRTFVQMLKSILMYTASWMNGEQELELFHFQTQIRNYEKRLARFLGRTEVYDPEQTLLPSFILTRPDLRNKVNSDYIRDIQNETEFRCMNDLFEFLVEYNSLARRPLGSINPDEVIRSALKEFISGPYLLQNPHATGDVIDETLLLAYLEQYGIISEPIQGNYYDPVQRRRVSGKVRRFALRYKHQFSLYSREYAPKPDDAGRNEFTVEGGGRRIFGSVVRLIEDRTRQREYFAGLVRSDETRRIYMFPFPEDDDGFYDVGCRLSFVPTWNSNISKGRAEGVQPITLGKTEMTDLDMDADFDEFVDFGRLEQL